MKKTLKAAIGQVMYRTGLHRAFLRDTAVITAFHRIEDQKKPDAITVGVKEFETFCRHVGRHFTVVALSELLRRLEQGDDISNCMVITFDDGYEDNRVVAAEILQRYALPATFFIATSMIGTQIQPYWDRNNGVQTRWMTWDQVRELHQIGFEIGAHTQTHADLAALDEDAAAEEIRGSKQALEEALGTEIRLFSYPFGGKEHCTDAVRRMVEEMGLVCCPSCHGGLVRPADNPFRLRRVPVNRWYSSYWHLCAEIINDSRVRA